MTNRTMLDVGASTGVFASYFASVGWEVHACEPCPEVFAKLPANLSNMPNVRCHPVALTDRDGRETLHIAERTDGTVMDIHHTISSPVISHTVMLSGPPRTADRTGCGTGRWGSRQTTRSSGRSGQSNI
ncbi:MAG: hypothetical protein C3F08_00510 [Candidatus Methylomirabilota bacterium]|nr:MAG: hypothetical protein C3F08_00510 [candidate division NC10 bacterium]